MCILTMHSANRIMTLIWNYDKKKNEVNKRITAERDDHVACQVEPSTTTLARDSIRSTEEGILQHELKTDDIIRNDIGSGSEGTKKSCCVLTVPKAKRQNVPSNYQSR